VHANYPFLPKEMVDAMQAANADDRDDAPEQTPVRGRRRGQNRARQLAETTAREPGEDR